MYLYLDLIWLLNFCIDVLLLWLTALFRKLEFRWWRISLAAFVGSCYVLFLFFPPLQPFYTFTIKLLFSFLLILIAFGFGQVQKFVATFLTFYFVSFLTGGGILGLHYFLQSQHELVNGMVQTQSSGYGDPVSWLFVIMGFGFMLWFSRSRWHQIEVSKRSAQLLVQVRISFGMRDIVCQGLIDTGNRLYDPLTKTPVMMLDSSCLKEIMPTEVLKQLSGSEAEIGLGLEDLHEYPDWVKRIRIIPYRGVQQGMKLMYALKPNLVEIVQNNHEVYQTRQVLIGLNHQPLSKDGLFQAIVHPEILHNQQKEEAVVSC